MKKYSKRNLYLFTTLFIFLIALPCFSQDAADSAKKTRSVFETLMREDALHLHIKTKLKQVIKEKEKEEKIESHLTYKGLDGETIEWDIKVRTRGNMRKQICYMPPIKIYFPKDELDARGFKKKFNDYKLVLKCNSSKSYESYVLKEYLVYKMYNLMTPNGYKVQLVHVTIEDVDGKHKNIESYGFMIENDDELAYRLDGEIIEPRVLSPRAIVPKNYDMMSVFQFMVGNTDWYMYNKHNLKVLKPNVKGFPLIIPYDYDYAGIVGTGYAVPHEKLPIKSVRERFFLGKCREDGAYDETIQQYRDKKEVILTTCKDLTILEERARNQMLDYLDDFFEIIENPKKTRKFIVEHCDRHIKIN